MSTRTWKGTVLFTGTLATLAVAAGAKFAAADQGTAVGSTQAGVQAAAGTQAGTQTGTHTGATAAAGAQAATGTAKVLTGKAVSMPYGTVQVAVTFTGTTITSVQTLQAPTDRASGRINSYATPILAQEAVAAGSAQIDSVSGATFTSEAYKQSLQSAIDQLK